MMLNILTEPVGNWAWVVYALLMCAVIMFIVLQIYKAHKVNKKWKTTELAPGKNAVLMVDKYDTQVPVKIKEKTPIGRWIVEIEVSENSLRFPEGWKPNK